MHLLHRPILQLISCVKHLSMHVIAHCEFLRTGSQLRKDHLRKTSKMYILFFLTKLLEFATCGELDMRSVICILMFQNTKNNSSYKYFSYLQKRLGGLGFCTESLAPANNPPLFVNFTNFFFIPPNMPVMYI